MLSVMRTIQAVFSGPKGQLDAAPIATCVKSMTRSMMEK